LVESDEEFEGIVLIMDGMIIQSYRKKVKYSNITPDPYYSGAKKKTGLNFLAFIDFNGHIWWNTKLYPAGRTDQAIWNDEKLRNWFVENDLGVMADLGFTPNKKGEQFKIKSAQPFPYEVRSGDTDEAKDAAAYSTEVSKRRVLIENVFGRLKDWSIIGVRCRHFHPNAKIKGEYHDRLNLNYTLDIICCLHNIDLETHPLRL